MLGLRRDRGAAAMTATDSGLMPALLSAQADMPAIQKTKINPAFRSKYVSLDSLMSEVMPVLNRHGLIWVTLPGRDEHGDPALTYRLIHAQTGEAITGTMPLMLSKTDPQGQGSAITYARRYSLMAVLGLVADEDDDGNSASRRQPKGETGKRSNGNGDQKLATPEDIKEMVAAAQGLEPPQVKLALAACGLSGVTAYNRVPAEKVATLTAALAGSERAA